MGKSAAITLALVVFIVLCGLGIASSQAGTDRAELRAFYTAPPVIPHEVTDERDSSSCLMCHEKMMDLGDRVSTPTPHPQFSNCQQCHVRAVAPTWMGAKKVETAWEGLLEPQKGFRAHDKAPPTIPHRLFLRESCLTCHGAEQPNEERATSHPDRNNCRQCHMAVEDAQF